MNSLLTQARKWRSPSRNNSISRLQDSKLTASHPCGLCSCIGSVAKERKKEKKGKGAVRIVFPLRRCILFVVWSRERERDHVSLIIRNNYTTWLENIRASEGTWIALTVGLRSAARLTCLCSCNCASRGFPWGAAGCRGMQFREHRVLDWVDGTRQPCHADRRGKAVEKGVTLLA